jgi:hypothetical protein
MIIQIGNVNIFMLQNCGEQRMDVCSKPIISPIELLLTFHDAALQAETYGCGHEHRTCRCGISHVQKTPGFSLIE